MRVLFVAVASLIAGSAWAQEVEETQTESVNMEMGVPGMPMPMPMNVNVKVKTTTKTTRTTTREEVGPAPAVRGSDCGAGEDSGCTMRRNGHLPMDAESFLAFLESLRASHNEINRNEIAQTVLKGDYLTARQLGLVLDLFDNEITRFDVAKAAAPHLVNPKHAMALSSKFNNSIYATDFSKLMASQR